MKKNGIVFFGAMAAMLLAANANAAQIASKEYVDAIEDAIIGDVNTALISYSTTSQVEGMISDAVTAGTVDVAGKADKVDSATAGNLAGLNGAGNLTDSGVPAASITVMQNTIDGIDTDLTALEESVSDLEITVAGKANATDLTGLATKTELTDGLATKADAAATTNALAGKADAAAMATALADKADAAATTTALAGKADLQGAGSIVGEVATIDADGQYIRSGTAMSALATTENVTTIVQDAIEAAVDNINDDINDMEVQSNKSNNITTDSGSTTKYTTVNAVQMYALPRPPAACADSTQCVLAVNASGEPYWEIVVMP